MSTNKGFRAKPIAATKEQQLELFAEYVADNIRNYWSVHQIPISWSNTQHRLRQMKAPLVSYEELKQYTVKKYLTELLTLDNNFVYIPKEIVLNQQQQQNCIDSYRTKHEQLRQAKKDAKFNAAIITDSVNKRSTAE